MNASGNRVVFIGLDGATWTVLEPMARRDVIPNIARLMSRGSWGRMLTAMPPSTSPGWPSLLTGKNPGKTGVFWFKDVTKPGYNPGFAFADSIRSRLFPEYASLAGKRVCVLGFPVTYPVREVNGVWVSGFMTPGSTTDFYYPASLDGEGLRHIVEGEYKPKEGLSPADALEYLERLRVYISAKAETFLEFAARERWDLFMACFAETDRVQHFLWKYMVEGSEEYSMDGASEVRKSIDVIFGNIDSSIGGIYDIIGDDACYILGSDHGFTDTPKECFHINALLRDRGYVRSNISSIKRLLFKNRLIGRGEDELESSEFSPIRWDRTRAWSFPFQSRMAGIFINRKGRFREGFLDDTEADRTRDELEELLSGLVVDGMKPIKRVARREDVYAGPHTGYAPELLIFMEEGYETPSSFRIDLMASGGYFRPNGLRNTRSGTHHEHGVYLYAGQPFTHKPDGPVMDIESLAATTLYALGVPLPDDLDAKPAMEFVHDRYAAENEPNYISAGEYKEAAVTQASEDDSRRIEDELRNLGYM